MEIDGKAVVSAMDGMDEAAETLRAASVILGALVNSPSEGTHALDRLSTRLMEDAKRLSAKRDALEAAMKS